MSSIFTKIINRELPADIIYEDSKHLAFLDISPMEKGHTLIIPKKEYETIFEMPEDEYLELQKIVFKIAKHYEDMLGCGINILQNNKPIAGQEVPHVHFHVIPRCVEKDFLNYTVWESYKEQEKEEYLERLRLH